MKTKTLLCCSLLVMLIMSHLAFGAEPYLKVSDNGRYFIGENGKPFLYLADSAWQLFHLLNREDADEYLEIRAAQGFNVIYAIVVAEFAGLTKPNAYGYYIFVNNDPTQPVEEYFMHIDYIVEKANSLGIFVAMLPTWGDKVNKAWGEGPEIFNVENAYIFGKFLGERYKDKKVVWVNGGDRPPEQKKEVWTQIARGLRAGDGGSHLITFHGSGKFGRGSSPALHNEDWLDFNMTYSGHFWADPNYEAITRDYNLIPVKPTLDGEPKYENHPYNDDGAGYHADPKKWDGITRANAHVVRENAYWAMLAGAAGHVYGCNDVWQFYTGDREAIIHANTDWRKAIHFPGVVTLGYMKKLFELRPWYRLIPDQSLVVEGQGRGRDHVQVARADDGSFIVAYITLGSPVRIDVSRMSGEKINAHWFDPRLGTWKFIDAYSHNATPALDPPESSPYGDWVLVLDDASRNYPIPKN